MVPCRELRRGLLQSSSSQVIRSRTFPPRGTAGLMQKPIPNGQQRERGRRVLLAVGFPFITTTLHFQPSKGLFMNVINSPLPGSPLEERVGESTRASA